MEILLGIIILVGGLAAGIINTIVGGGSLISVPLLIFSGLPPQLAISTNRFGMIFNSGVAAYDYYKEQKFEIRMLVVPTLFAVIGSAMGANTVLQLDEVLIKYIIAIFIVIIGSLIFYKKELGLEQENRIIIPKNNIIVALFSFVLGFYGGFYGAGISTMFSFLFVSVFGLSFLKSAGITRFVVAALSVIAVLIFLINIKIDLFYGGLLTISFILGAKVGVKIASKIGNLWIRRLMIVLIAISSIKLIFF
jgi:uncharacterized membrane protein YfcA